MRTDFEVLEMKGFKVEFGVLEKSKCRKILENVTCCDVKHLTPKSDYLEFLLMISPPNQRWKSQE